MSRETTWRALCVQADPDFNRMSRWTVSYEFTAPGGRSSGDERTHEFGKRIFLEDYAHTGPYAPETVVTDGLTFNGIPVTFNDVPVTFDAD
jgi:hypothetical protein